ncbi:DUF6483 family protein [Companilactobacillus musae]|uniref:DUF6483 family protein n=1 Tax=Companilactobacillus musae TaxID=1903258 RepID=UPI000E654E79|nr:DUF6483 family protein [Companilactobacillus musae]
MDDDNDFIMRQIKSFAEGFGYMVGKKGANKTEIVFEQQQNQRGKIYTDIDNLLLHHKYEAAINYVYSKKFVLDRKAYLELGQWLITRLKGDPEVSVQQLQEFIHNINKYQKPML